MGLGMLAGTPVGIRKGRLHHRPILPSICNPQQDMMREGRVAPAQTQNVNMFSWSKACIDGDRIRSLVKHADQEVLYLTSDYHL